MRCVPSSSTRPNPADVRGGALVGFGCMRLSTDPGRDELSGLETIAAAISGGANLLDTAPSYALGEEDAHHNERLVARALASASACPLVSTKGGLVREGRAWVVDGRAKALRASCERSVEALSGRVIDIYLLHAVDPRTPLATSVRALAELQRAGLVRRIGLSNVTSGHVEEARRHAEIAVVQIAAGAFDHAAFRGGVVRHCLEAGIEIHAHSPFGGARRARRLAADPLLREIAEKAGVSPFAVVIAWLTAHGLVAIPGARDPERARGALLGARIALDPADIERLDGRFGGRPSARIQASADASAGEVVLVMGIQGSGKSDSVKAYEERGYARLNRDTLGGTLRGIAQRLDEMAAAGVTRFVLDNTYASRASRAEVIQRAAKHGLAVRCVFLDTPLEHAQLNAVERLCDRYGRLPSPEELRALQRKDPHAFAPTVQLRARRELELPTVDEGFQSIEHVAFERRVKEACTSAALVLELKALEGAQVEEIAEWRAEVRAELALVFAWGEGQTAEALRARAEATGARAGLADFDVALCPHPGGPPICWCRPPLPGLLVPWLRERSVDPRRSMLVGTHATHEAMARAFTFGAYRRVG